MIGTPKYFPKSDVKPNPNMLLISLALLTFTF
jgi:hypothetical protein